MRRTGFILLFVILFWVSSCSHDSGTVGLPPNTSLPTISSVSPSVVNPGMEEVEGRIIGTNFTGVMAVSLGDNIKIHVFTPISNTEIYVFFTVFKDAAPGPRNVLVSTTAGSVSVPSLLSVSDNRVPEAKIKVTPATGSKDTLFRFDASDSNDDGHIADYKWKFGDGKQASGKVVTHRFDRGGEFEVNLTLIDDQNAEVTALRTLEVTSSALPVASFTVTPENGSIETLFKFDASSSRDPDGRIVDYVWYLDGAVAHGKVVEHRFSRSGSLQVALTVIDNSRESQLMGRLVGVGTGGGGNPPPPVGGGECAVPAKDRGLIFGTVVGVDGFNAIVQFPAGSTCANTFYNCGDMRKASPENFYGIIREMTDLGGGKFKIFNDCPFRWPPPVGETVFLIYKTCAKNFCP